MSADEGVTGELLANNERFAEAFDRAGLPIPPSLNLAVVACMDARLDAIAALGLEPGQAHVIRNAGGVVTDDVIRSLTISQRALGTREIILIHHTDCGMATLTEDGFRAQILDDTGMTPPFAIESFGDVDTDVRQSIARLRSSPFLPHKDRIRGFVYEVETGRLREVESG